MSSKQLREFLTLMKEFGIDHCKSGDMEFWFTGTRVPSLAPAETGDDRLERLKREFAEANEDAAKLDAWST